MAGANHHVPTAVLEWAIGPISRYAEDMWICSPMADAVERVLQSSAARVTVARLEALQTAGATSISCPLLQREYAALFEPLRLARRAALAYCTAPGDASGAFCLDAGDRRRIPSEAIATVLPIDAASVTAGVTTCATALSSAVDARAELTSSYDELGFPPARVARRFAQLQADGLEVPAAAVAPREREYAALFKPVRLFRHSLRDALQGVAPGDAPGAAGGCESSSTLSNVVRRLQVTMAPVQLNAVEDAIMASIPDCDEASRAVVARSAIALLRAKQHVVTTAERACSALKVVANSTDGAHSVVTAGGIPDIVAALSTHASSEVVAAGACSVLADAAALRQCHSAITSSGAIPLIVAALTAHEGSASVVYCACHALAQLTHRPGEAQRAVAAAGVTAPLLTAVRLHRASILVVANACILLEQLGFHVDMRAVAAAGGMRTLFDALKAHAKNPSVTTCVCGALANVASSGGVSSTVQTPADDVALLLAALKAHEREGRIVSAACETLYHIALFKVNQPMLVAAGGIEAIAAVVKAHAVSSQRAEMEACHTLLILASADSGAVAASASGSAAAAPAAATRHVRDLAAVETALRTLTNHASRAVNREWIVGNGGSQLVVAALDEYTASAPVAELACTVLAGLSLYHVGSSAIALSSGLHSVLTALRTHRTAPRVAAAACNALRFLCHPGWDGHNAMTCSASSAQELVAAMAAHPTHAGIAQSACATLQVLATDPEQRTAIIEAGGVAVVRAALAAHAKSAETVAAATATLRLLAPASGTAA